ncbi:MAG: cytochrome c [Deltaproteobacteria bacterium]
MRTILVLVILFIAAFFVYIYSGTYNIAATVPHSEAAKWVFNTMKIYSVKKHAEDIEPPKLDDEKLVKTGFSHYDDMCAGCHGAPGSEPAESFNPAPPALAERVSEFSPAELFWIIKNGIKMTAMPEFGSTHSEDELWGIVAFTVKLPDISPDEYKGMQEESEHTQHEHNHQREHESETDMGNHKEDSKTSTDTKNEGDTHIHTDGKDHRIDL